MAGPCGDARNDRAVPLQFTPGSACSYSNSNYFVLGSVIEAVTSGSYSDNLLLHVLRAAGLGSTFYQPPAGAQPSLRPDGEWAHADDGASPLRLVLLGRCALVECSGLGDMGCRIARRAGRPVSLFALMATLCEVAIPVSSSS